MSEERRSYFLNQNILVNDLYVKEVVIDSHVDKHNDHISDDIILSLVKMLDGKTYVASSIKDGFSYFVTNLEKEEYIYRLVWLQEDGCLYIGVLTAFRDKGVKS